MKFVISLLLTSSAFASPIRIYHEQNDTRAQIVKAIFMDVYSVPDDLIVVKAIQNCSEVKNKGRLDLCLKNNGDLLVVSVDRGFINESLKIFRAP